jgi:MFS family permease
VWVDASGDRKNIFLFFLYAQRVFWILIALVPLGILMWDPPHAKSIALWTALGLIACSFMVQSVGSPAWISWMADLVPADIRGRYFAKRRMWGIVSAVITVIVVAKLIDWKIPKDTDPITGLKWMALILGVAAFLGILDIFFFRYIPHVPPIRKEKPPLLLTLRQAFADRPYLKLCIFASLVHFSVASTGQFTALYLRERVGLDWGTMTYMLFVAPQLAMLLVIPFWGKWVDKIGPVVVLKWSTIALIPIGMGWCVANLGPWWIGFVLASLGAMAWYGLEAANFNITLKMSSSRDESGKTGGSTYWALNALLFSVAGVASSWLTGWLMQALKGYRFTVGNLPEQFTEYEIFFAISVVMRIVPVVAFWGMLNARDSSGGK